MFGTGQTTVLALIEKHCFFEQPQQRTVDGFILVGINFRGLNKNYPFMGFRIRGHSIFFNYLYRKFPFRGYWNMWIGPSTKTTKIGTHEIYAIHSIW